MVFDKFEDAKLEADSCQNGMIVGDGNELEAIP
jgi:hypothetical protein